MIVEELKFKQWPKTQIASFFVKLSQKAFLMCLLFVGFYYL